MKKAVFCNQKSEVIGIGTLVSASLMIRSYHFESSRAKSKRLITVAGVSSPLTSYLAVMKDGLKSRTQEENIVGIRCKVAYYIAVRTNLHRYVAIIAVAQPRVHCDDERKLGVYKYRYPTTRRIGVILNTRYPAKRRAANPLE